MPAGFRRDADLGFRGSINLIFPDDCRLCGEALRELSRIPVCAKCLLDPQPLIAEHFCIACRTPFVNAFPLDETGHCMLCRLGLRGFDAVYSYGSYDGTLRKLIHLFKFEKIHTLAKPLGNFLALVLPREERFDVIVPMPLHWRRRWERGFNQSELLAREIGRRWNVPVEKAVRRVKPTAPQAGLTNAKRRANVSGAFAAQKGRLDGARVLLVDDVMTTGATSAACAAAMKRAGAARVALLAVARTDRRMALQSFEMNPGAASAAGAGRTT